MSGKVRAIISLIALGMLGAGCAFISIPLALCVVGLLLLIDMKADEVLRRR